MKETPGERALGFLGRMFDGMEGDARKPGSDMAAHMPVLYALARRYAPLGPVVELGVNRGWSTVALYLGVQEQPGFDMVSYDHRAVCEESLAKNLGVPRKHASLSRWGFRVKDSVQAAADWKDGEVSLLFLDTSHLIEHTRRELAAWVPKIHELGSIVGHDYLLKEYAGVPYGVKEAVDEIASKHADRWRLQVFPDDCGLFFLRPR